MLEPPQSHYRNASSKTAALKIGLLLDSVRTVPAYAARIFRDILTSNFMEIAVVVVQKDAVTTKGNRKQHFLYERYLRLDQRMKTDNDPLVVVDCTKLLASVEAIEIERSTDQQRLPSEVLDKIRSKGLDVFIRFGFDRVPDDLFKAAQFGVWSLQHGDTEFYRGGPSHFWEIREGNPISGVVLQGTMEPGGEPLVLAKGLFATEQTISVSRNRYIPYWGSTDLFAQKLYELHEFGWDYVVERALPPVSYRGKRDPYASPRSGEMLAWFGPIILKKAVRYPFRKPTVQHWRIAIRRSAVPLFDAQADCSGFRWIEPPRGHAWADPFLFEHEGKYWAFFEDYSYEKKRANIACAQVSREGEWGTPVVCLEHPDRHYSYPYIFRDGSQIFMIPESYESNSVDLYRCKTFPNQWVREAALLEGRFVDSTIWQHDGLWWFATTSVDPMPGANALWLYYSSSLNGDWKFHPQNPISRDIRNNRGAGRVFRNQNRLIRPSQSGAPTYGYSLTFSEITELSKQHYAERPLKTVTPEQWRGIAGVHTYGCVGDLEAIDGRTPRALHELI